MSRLPPDLYAALEQAAGVGTLLVASDFDGALAEFTSDPQDSAPAPGAMPALRGLAALPDTHVAVVSGRDLSTLKELTGVGSAEPIDLIGSHGAESTRSGVTDDAGLDAAQRALLDILTEQVAELIQQHPGARLERKRAAVVLHTRGLASEPAAAALQAAEGLATSRAEVRVMQGKSVVELSVSHADKGTGVSALARVLHADATLYTGDDVTDEDAFRVLDPLDGDVTVKVGSGETAASHRVGSVAEVVAMLEELLRLREAAVRDRSASAAPPRDARGR